MCVVRFQLTKDKSCMFVSVLIIQFGGGKGLTLHELPIEANARGARFLQARIVWEL